MTRDDVRPAVSTFLQTLSPTLLIDGRWTESADDLWVDVLDPSTGEAIAQVSDASEMDVDRAVGAARRALEHGPWATMSPRDRGRLLMRLSNLLEEHAEDLAQLESLDNGKTVASARGYDIDGTVHWFEYFAGWPSKMGGTTLPTGTFGQLVYTVREPMGVVGQIIPWNYPLLMAAWKLAPALASGCTVILKPAEETPLTALFLGRLIQAAGFPDGVVNILTGTGARTGAAMVDHPGIDKIAFTGSTETGRTIMGNSSASLKRLTFELGGNNPNIVLDDADVAAIGPQLADAVFANHGQNCCAGTRLFVQRGILDDVTDAVTAAARSIVVGPGLDPGTDMGPLISATQLRRVTDLVDDGRSRGVQVVTGGQASDDNRGFFMAPTVILDADDQVPVVSEEIFGPVITVLPFDDIDEVVRRANSSAYGLAAGIWTKDLTRAHTVARRIKSGTVWINTYNQTNPAVPFGGFKNSGFGREHGSAVLDHYTETKSIWVG